MRIDTNNQRHEQRVRALLVASIILSTTLVGALPTTGAVIGVLSDGRQSEFLSLLGDSSAQARLTLATDGHELIEIASLSLPVLNTVEVLWLPLLDLGESYTAQERTNVVQFAVNGGAVIWIGDADVFNAPDNSFLSAFGMSKLPGNLNIGLAPAISDHPVVTGPHGAVALIAENAGYGLFSGTPEVADVFAADPEPGTFAGFLDASSGFDGAGRVAFICDASIFGQLLGANDHETFLRNVVKWGEAALGYTPSGSSVSTGDLGSACEACLSLELVFAIVTTTGETALSQGGRGRCNFPGVASGAPPVDFLGYSLTITTTATYPEPADIEMTLAYDSDELASLGIADEAALRLYKYDAVSEQAVEIFAVVDTIADTITCNLDQLGTLLLGAIVAATDCNSNGIPDVCEIDENSAAPGGPFYCTEDCDPDCNDNGIPDACDIAGGQSQDCNDNDVPDECEPDVQLTVVTADAKGGSTVPNGSAARSLCEIVSITATANDGYCFSGWTVNTGAVPADSDAPDTTVIADLDKTVTAGFTQMIIEQPDDVAICEGSAAMFNVLVHGDYAASAQYAWQLDGLPVLDGGAVSGATAATLQIDPAGAEHAGAYTCIVDCGCGTTTTEPATLTIGLDPGIVADPVDASACPGDSATFEVDASGTTLAYQWQVDAGGGFVDLEDGVHISGSQTATLTVNSITANEAGQYRCLIAGACGTPVTSASAELTVGEGLQITADPEDQAACPGDTRSLTVTVDGTGLTYEWQFDDGQGGGFVILSDDDHISGAASATLTVTDIDFTHAGDYQCRVAGECGTPVLCNAATLTVNTLPVIGSSPVDQFACPGNDVSFTMTAAGTGVAYQWQFDGSGNFVDLSDDENTSGSATSILSLTSVDAARAGQYRCAVSGVCGVPLHTDAAMLTVGDGALIVSQPVAQLVCPGGATIFEVEATGTDLTYQWQFSSGSGQPFVALFDDAHIGGAASPTLTVSGAMAEHDGEYRCVVVATCGIGVATDAVVLDVNVGECDCNDNGVPDVEDISQGTSQDCNANGVPDECDIGDGASLDCDSNGIPDECDLLGGAPDCNENGVPDACDLSAGDSQDCNADGVPDECQLDGNDCNGNGVPDECDPPYVADAGEDFAVCVLVPSQEMGGPTVASGSTPPYTYLWQVIAGPDGGGTILGETATRPRFVATLPGDYMVELTVSDSSQPPCVTTDFVLITAAQTAVDAGEPFTMCVDATSAALSPVVDGGVPPYTWVWSIDAGSPSDSADQFTGDGPFSENPTFTPDAPGQYVLRVTVTGSGDPACEATDTVFVNAIGLDFEPPADFAMGVNTESAPLETVITSNGTPPHAYAWTIEPGSPNMGLSQITGTGPASPSPTFRPVATGVYVLRVTVTDSSTPDCEVSKTVHVTVSSMTVDAGDQETLCIGADGIRLSPSVQGGHGELVYSWTVEPGSPSTDPGQFIDPHQFAASPLFVPAAVGNYQLRLTVTDAGTPPSVASDVLIVRATTMTVDAGDAFVTQAFRASRGLGAIPVVGGGDAPYVYQWVVDSGANTNASQFSATDVEHPSFTPSAVGEYLLKVTVSDANGTGCAISDFVVVEAIASALTQKVNSEGRLFMSLQIDAPHTKAEVRVSDAAPGARISADLRDDGGSANFDGLVHSPGLSRRLVVTSELGLHESITVVVLYYNASEIGSLNKTALRVQWFNGDSRWWVVAGDKAPEQAPYPLRPTRWDLGRHGVDTVNKCVWAVVDHWGEFSVGVSSGEAPPAAQPDATGPITDSGDPLLPPIFGFCGGGFFAPILATCLICAVCRRRSRRAAYDRGRRGQGMRE
ncbi:MAG: hypothetical protein ABII12_16545 [Planctomycetota bacterium]